MTSQHRTPEPAAGTASSIARSPVRKSLTLMQMLALVAFGGLVASLVIRQFV